MGFGFGHHLTADFPSQIIVDTTEQCIWLAFIVHMPN